MTDAPTRATPWIVKSQQTLRAPPEGLVRQVPDHGVTTRALAPTLKAPLIRLNDLARQAGATRLGLPDGPIPTTRERTVMMRTTTCAAAASLLIVLSQGKTCRQSS